MHLVCSTVNSLFKSVNLDDKKAIVAIESPISQSKMLSVFSKMNFINSLASELFFLNIFLIAGKGLCNIFYKVKWVVKCRTKICLVLKLVDSFSRYSQRDKIAVFYVLSLVVHLCYIS